MYDKSAQFIKGVGPARFKSLNRLGINSIYDLLYFFPRRYEDRSKFISIADIKPDINQTVKGNIVDCRFRKTRRGLSIAEIEVADDTGAISCIWFNQPYLKNVFRPGSKIVLYGKIDSPFKIQMNSPEYEIIKDETEDSLSVGRIVPVYSLTEKLSQKIMRSVIYEGINKHLQTISDCLPYDIRSRNGLPNIAEAIKWIHFPQNFAQQGMARRRFVYEEFFLLQLGIGIKRLKNKTTQEGISHHVAPELLDSFLRQLSFKLTESQEKVIKEIESDMSGVQPMHRLLQGEVGSGKTVVAAYALLLTVNNGYQGALLVPTEILAEQHFFNLSNLLLRFNVNAGLLISGISNDLKKKTKEELKEGKIDVIIGTHSLLEEDIIFKKLGLVVIDEQHKFGVMQRKTLIDKGLNSDVLIMTATPIPRTLALTVYGDMDISTLRELPKGRKTSKTFWVSESKREEVYNFIINQITEGRQAFIVYPLIEESEDLDLKAATGMFEEMKNGVFCQYRVGLIHGQIATQDKDKIMTDFREHKLDILVSTIVIEVGIDIPNVSVMLIENAERFGLAQLHQLRGRIGRGKHQSYCILISNATTEEARQRLSTLVSTQDGFKIAEQDLKIRGPGEFFGELQHGLPQIRIADITEDMKILENTRREAFNLLRHDPFLSGPKHRVLLETLKERFPNLDLLSIG